MTDTELFDFVELRGIQIWPQRKSKHGPIMCWWVQNPSPFFQTSSPSLRVALQNLKKVADEVDSKQSD